VSKKLTDICNITTGKLDSNAAKNGGKYPFFTCSPDPLQIDNYAFDADAILLAGNNANGNFHINRFKGKFNAYQRTYILTVKDKYDTGYAFYALKFSLNHFKKIAQGSNTKFLTTKILSSFNIMNDSPSEQKRIASVLSSLDDKIALNKKISKELESMAKTLYNYWFVQFDFPDEKGKPYKSSGGKMVYSNELKRKIPQGWEVCALCDIANITMGQSPDGDSYNKHGEGFIFYQGATDFGNRFSQIRQFTTKPARFAKEGDILLSVRAPVGAINITSNDCCIGRGLVALNSKNNTITYLYEVLKNLSLVFKRRNTTGTTFGAMTKDDLFSLKVVRPIYPILILFHEVINPMFINSPYAKARDCVFSQSF
jgi:type I restriction enzyme S subunit